MKRKEFKACMRELQANTTLGDLDAITLGIRLETFWNAFGYRNIEDLKTAVKWLIVESEARFFPTLAELMEALRAATTPRRHPSDCPLCDGSGWRLVKGSKGEGVTRCKGEAKP